MLRSFVLLLLATAGSAALAAGPAPADLAVIHRYALGGPGGWDYLAVDVSTHRLFIARDDRVMAVDTRSGRLAGEIPGMQHVHGVALDPAARRGYASNGAGNSVSVIDLDALRTLGTIPVSGKNPDAIVFDAASGHVLTMDGHSASASVIDPRSLREVATIALPGRPEFAVSDGQGHVFANIEDRSELAEIDTRTNRVAQVWNLAPCDSPSGLAYAAGTRRLFSVCANKWMIVTAADDGHQVAKLPIGEDPDAAAFDPRTRLAWSSNRDGTLSIVREDDANHYRVVATVQTQVGARTMALDPQTHDAYLVAAQAAPRGAPVKDFTLLVVGRRGSAAAGTQDGAEGKANGGSSGTRTRDQ